MTKCLITDTNETECFWTDFLFVPFPLRTRHRRVCRYVVLALSFPIRITWDVHSRTLRLFQFGKTTRSSGVRQAYLICLTCEHNFFSTTSSNMCIERNIYIATARGVRHGLFRVSFSNREGGGRSCITLSTWFTVTVGMNRCSTVIITNTFLKCLAKCPV